jgi:hydroxymethylbilane synthase
VDTRLRKLREGRFDAIVLALAGLSRLGMASVVTQILPFDLMLPAPGQGALGLEIRRDNQPVADLLAHIADRETTAAVTAERALLEALGGGCSLPLGAYAFPETDGGLELRAVLASLDGRTTARAERKGRLDDPIALARQVAADLRRRGADAILDSLDLT